MALKVGKKLIEDVQNSEYEFKREKEDVSHYFKKYDSLIENFID